MLKPLTLESESSVNKSISCGSDNGSDNDDSLVNSDIKSPISIVHEMALKRKMSVTFEVQSEKGPPHMKVYTTLCKVGTLVVSIEVFLGLELKNLRNFQCRPKAKEMAKSSRRKKPRKR